MIFKVLIALVLVLGLAHGRLKDKTIPWTCFTPNAMQQAPTWRSKPPLSLSLLAFHLRFTMKPRVLVRVVFYPKSIWMKPKLVDSAMLLECMILRLSPVKVVQVMNTVTLMEPVSLIVPRNFKIRKTAFLFASSLAKALKSITLSQRCADATARVHTLRRLLMAIKCAIWLLDNRSIDFFCPLCLKLECFFFYGFMLNQIVETY